MLRVAQREEDAWLRGFTIGTRARWSSVRACAQSSMSRSACRMRRSPDSAARHQIQLSGGDRRRHRDPGARASAVTVTGRWFHVSNSGREGRDRNPDIQSLGAVVGVGWKQ